MKQTIILILCLLGCCVASGESLAPDSLFIRLDASIANRSFYIEQKNDTLIELKNRLLNAASLEQKYELSKEAQAVAQEDAGIYTVALYGAVFGLSDRVTNFDYNAAAHDFIVPYNTDLA